MQPAAVAETSSLVPTIGSLLAKTWPVIAAGAAGALVPRRDSRAERFWLGLSAALCVMFLIILAGSPR